MEARNVRVTRRSLLGWACSMYVDDTDLRKRQKRIKRELKEKGWARL